MTESKKPWLEPELIVLVRNKPEEAILEVCKTSSVTGSSGSEGGCESTIVGPCEICAELTPS